MPWTLDIDGLIKAGLSAAVVVGGIAYLLKLYADSRIKAGFTQAEQARKAQFDTELATRQAAFTQELERLKAELNREAEAIKHRQQRDMTNFTLFAAKRQDVYARVFALMTESVERGIVATQGAAQPEMYASMPRHAVEREFTRAGMDTAGVTAILSTFTDMPAVQRGDVMAKEYTFQTQVAYRDAQRAALSYGYANSLYLSDAVGSAFNAVIRMTKEEDAANFERIGELVADLRRVMQQELSGGAIDNTQHTPTP